MATTAPASPPAKSAPAPAQQQQSRPPRNRPNYPRSASLENYQRIEKPRDATPEDEIRVTANGRPRKYVNYAMKLFEERQKRAVTIRATGVAVAVAVSVAEGLKRRLAGLHQLTTIGWTEITDEYEPLVAGLANRSETRSVPSISIVLSLDGETLDQKAVGYQPPLDLEKLNERTLTPPGSSRGPRPRPDPRGPRSAEEQPGSLPAEGQQDEAPRKPRRPRRRRAPPAGGAPQRLAEKPVEVKTEVTDAKQTDISPSPAPASATVPAPATVPTPATIAA